MPIKTILLTLAAVTAFSTSTAYAAGSVNLVKNGGFEQASGTGQFNINGNNSVTVTDWKSTGYNFLFTPGSADNTQSGSLGLWGAKNGGANSLAVSSNGGNFMAADGAYHVGAISQIISGLVSGKKYTVNFEWGAAQQYGFTGATTDQWVVNLGSDSATAQSTAVYSDASHSSSPWMQETMTFTATGATEVLSFLAQGTPSGEPPFALLDGVSMVAAVPEPETWGMLIGGLSLIGFMARRRRDVI